MNEGFFRLLGRFETAHGWAIAKCRGLLCVVPEQTGWTNVKPRVNESLQQRGSISFAQGLIILWLNIHCFQKNDPHKSKLDYRQWDNSKWWLSPFPSSLPPQGNMPQRPTLHLEILLLGSSLRKQSTGMLRDSFTIIKLQGHKLQGHS